MSIGKCKHCHKQVSSELHHCSTTGKTYREDDSGDFLLSLAVGALTDSAIIGTIVGGDVVGGVVGDLLDFDLFD